MREILFRGKQKSNGVWLFGDLRQWSATRKGICDYALKSTNEVDPSTVGQYTGLTDKNGVKIFEGDIVRVERWLYSGENKKEREVFNGVVWYDENHTCFGLRSTKYRCLPIARFKGDYSTVVGNIHDNPELIGGTDNA